MRDVRMLLGVAVVGALLLLGCGDDGESGTDTTPEPTTIDAPLEVEVTEDVAFTSERTLDVYAPTEGSGWPVVVHFHGGLTSPESFDEFARAVAQQGVVVVVPEWRSLGPAGGSEDTVCAVAYATAHAEDYGADPEQVTLSGYSTGGYTALIHAFMGDDPPLPVTDCEVDAVMEAPGAVVAGGAPIFAAEWAREGLLAGNPQWAVLTPEQLDAFDPYLVLGRNPDLRIRLVVGEDDVGGNPDIVQPIAESNRAYVDALVDAGYDVELIEVPGGHLDGPTAPGPERLDTYVDVVAATAHGE